MFWDFHTHSRKKNIFIYGWSKTVNNNISNNSQNQNQIQ